MLYQGGWIQMQGNQPLYSQGAVIQINNNQPNQRGNQAKRGPRLCLKGRPTHGHYAENGNYGGPDGQWQSAAGPETTEVGIANFVYTPGDAISTNPWNKFSIKLDHNLSINDRLGFLFHWGEVLVIPPSGGPTGGLRANRRLALPLR